MSSHTIDIHMRTDAKNLVTTASSTALPTQKGTSHMINNLRRESLSGNIHDLAHVSSEDCLSDCLTKAYTGKLDEALRRAVSDGVIRNVDLHKPFRGSQSSIDENPITVTKNIMMDKSGNGGPSHEDTPQCTVGDAAHGDPRVLLLRGQIEFLWVLSGLITVLLQRKSKHPSTK